MRIIKRIHVYNYVRKELMATMTLVYALNIAFSNIPNSLGRMMLTISVLSYVLKATFLITSQKNVSFSVVQVLSQITQRINVCSCVLLRTQLLTDIFNKRNAYTSALTLYLLTRSPEHVYPRVLSLPITISTTNLPTNVLNSVFIPFSGKFKVRIAYKIVKTDSMET